MQHFQELHRQRVFCRQWLLLIKSHQILKEDFERFDFTRQATIKHYRQLFCAFLIKLKFRTYCSHLAHSREVRGLQRVKQAFSFVSVGFMDRKVENARAIVKAFLTETRDIYILKQNIIQFYKKIQYV